MTYSVNKIPLFQELEDSKSILIAGAGGGFDVFCGIPLYFSLINQGKKVVIGNFSFTSLAETNAELVYPYCYKIRAEDMDLTMRNYFPEKYLKQWLSAERFDTEVYGFERIGVNPLQKVYQYLIKEHNLDTIILIDGGTDSLMFGDEEGLGTPHEDICSMAAVYKSGIEKQFLVSLGFGVDHYHGVSHFRFLENVAEIASGNGYMGCFQITKEMSEAKKYIEAVDYVNKRMRGFESIVSNSIISALEGKYGNYHKTNRTNGSRLWINPLMTIYWSFDLREVIKKIKYYDFIKDVNTIGEFNGKLAAYRSSLKGYRDKKQMPI